MHHNYQNHTLEVAQEDIFIRILEFQRHQIIQWDNTQNIQHHEKINVIVIGGRCGGFFTTSHQGNQKYPTLRK